METGSFLALFRELSSIEHVVGVGAGTKWLRGEDTNKPAVVILVDKKYPKGDLKRASLLPRSIGGRVTDVIEVGNIRLLSREEPISHTGNLRPAQPGISIGHYSISAGTFGAVVYDNATGEPLILSNNHVLACSTNGSDNRSQRGDKILQPGSYDGGKPDQDTIGYLERFIPLQRETMISSCRIAHTFEELLNRCIGFLRPEYHVRVVRDNVKTNQVDCAVARPTDSAMIVPEILEIGSIQGIRNARIGMTVKKSGRTSGLTHSMVLATNVTFKVGIDNNEYGVFTDQILSGPMSMPGDSGSLILDEENFAIGLLFAGSEQATMFNPIENVLNALHVRLLPSS